MATSWITNCLLVTCYGPLWMTPKYPVQAHNTQALHQMLGCLQIVPPTPFSHARKEANFCAILSRPGKHPNGLPVLPSQRGFPKCPTNKLTSVDSCRVSASSKATPARSTMATNLCLPHFQPTNAGTRDRSWPTKTATCSTNATSVTRTNSRESVRYLHDCFNDSRK